MEQKLVYSKISITGDLGSGKSIISKLLNQKLGLKIYSTGDIQRRIASKYGVSTLGLNKISEKNFDIDNEIDTFSKKLNESNESFIIDSRIAWHFIPNSFKIYLQVNLDIAAKRILSDKSRKSENYPDLDSAKNDITKRKESENYRFKKLYHIDCNNMENYDLVIDTSYSTPEHLTKTILNNLDSLVHSEYKHKYWLPPKILYPTQHIIKIGREPIKKLVNLVKKNGYDNRFSIDVISKDKLLYIYDGHKRASAALFNDISLIPVDIFAKDEEEIRPGLSVNEFISTTLRDSWIRDWEGCHKFHFLVYPAINS